MFCLQKNWLDALKVWTCFRCVTGTFTWTDEFTRHRSAVIFPSPWCRADWIGSSFKWIDEPLDSQLFSFLRPLLFQDCGNGSSNNHLLRYGKFLDQRPLLQVIITFVEILITMTIIEVSMFSDCADKRPARQGEDMEAARRLWVLSEKLVGYSMPSE